MLRAMYNDPERVQRETEGIERVLVETVLLITMNAR